MRKLLMTTAALIALSITPALANHTGQTMAGEDVRLKVNGLVCDFCAQAIHKVFNKREEVNDVLVDLDTMNIHVDYKDGQSISDEELNALVTNAGYSLVSINDPSAPIDESGDSAAAPAAETQPHNHEHNHSEDHDMEMNE